MIKPIEIPGFEHYLIDTNGTIWSTIHRRWRTKLKEPRVRRYHPNKNTGYHQVILQNIPDGHKPVLYYVHRLVAQHFIPNPDNLAEVNHKDFDITNNKVENLEWCTSNHNKTNKNRANTKIGKLLKNDKLIQEGIDNYLKYQRKSYLMILWGMYDKAVNEVLKSRNIQIRTSQRPKR